MDKLFYDYITGSVTESPCTRFDTRVFSNGETLTGSTIYYFFTAAAKFDGMYVATSVNDAIANNVPIWVSPRGCRKGHAPIRNLDNECIECNDTAAKQLDGRATVSTQMMRDYPDMILDYDTARTLGFTVYRTGVKCWQGHTGYRYVKNKTCIECSRLGR